MSATAAHRTELMKPGVVVLAVLEILTLRIDSEKLLCFGRHDA
jgi:hypothetical protein